MTAIGSTIGVLATANVLAHRVVPRAAAAVAGGKVAGLAVIARGAGLTTAELGLDRHRWASGGRWGAGAAGLVAAGYAVVLAVPTTRAAIPGSGTPWCRAAFRATVVIPLTTVLPEEFAFRGVLPALLTRRFGARPAGILTAGLFGLWHVLPGLAGGGAANDAVTGVLGADRRAAVVRVGGTVLVTTGGGLVLGEVRRRSGSLLAPILLHWAINGLGELIAGRPGTAQPSRPNRPSP